jgi:hypothetical protein
MTAVELRTAEARYKRASLRYEEAREARNAAIRAALAEGWTHAQIAEETGLSRGRVGQIPLATSAGALSPAGNPPGTASTGQHRCHATPAATGRW